MQFAGTSGYKSDAATGLLLLGHRYYDASIGRFLSSDPAQAGSKWYDYCDNNPLVRVDPTGLIPPIGYADDDEDIGLGVDQPDDYETNADDLCPYMSDEGGGDNQGQQQNKRTNDPEGRGQ